MKGRTVGMLVGVTGLLLIDIVAFGSVPWPLARTPITVDSDYVPAPRHHVDACGEVGLLDWPPDASVSNREYLLAHVSHERPLPYGVNTFLTAPVLGDPLVQVLLRQLEALPQRTRNRDVPQRVHLPVTPANAETNLCALGIGEVRLHPETMSDREISAAKAWLNASLLPIPSEAGSLRWATRR